MKKGLIVIGLALALMVVGRMLVMESGEPGPVGGSEEDRIRQEVEEARACTKDSDCEVVTGQCPLGCWVAVNRRDADRIQRMMNDFRSDCVYSCIAHEGARCTNGACEVRIPQP